MFLKIKNNFRPLPNYSTYNEYIIKTNNKYYDSIKKDCENYVFKKKMRELINNDFKDYNDNKYDKDDNLSVKKYNYDTSYDFLIITISTFSIGIYSFLYFYRFKK
jgi:hypothetical protein